MNNPLGGSGGSQLQRHTAREGEVAHSGEFNDLILPHLDAAYNLARFLARDPTAADDIVQEAFLRAFRSFAGYRGGDPKSWLLAIVRNCSFSWMKAHRAEAAPAESEAEPAASEPQEAQLLRAAEIEALRSAIEELAEPFRETLVLRELEELSYKQIAEITGVPVGTVMSRLARARQMLSRELLRRNDIGRE